MLPAPQLAGCAQILASHFRNVQVFRFGVARVRSIQTDRCVCRGTLPTRTGPDAGRRHFILPEPIDRHGRQYELLPLLSAGAIELRVPPSGPAELSYAGLPLDAIEDLLPASPAYRQIAQILDPQPVALNTRPLTPLHKGTLGYFPRPGF